MDKRKAKQLEKLGFSKMWIRDVMESFKPKKKGKYKMEIYDMEEIDQDPDEGIHLDTAYFDNERELSIIHHFFEGNGYVMYLTETGEIIGRGIIDGAPFDEVEEIEGETWEWSRLNSWYQYNQAKHLALRTSTDDVQGILSLLRNRLAEIRTTRRYGEVVQSAKEEELEMLIDTITEWRESK